MSLIINHDEACKLSDAYKNEFKLSEHSVVKKVRLIKIWMQQRKFAEKSRAKTGNYKKNISLKGIK